MTREYYDHGYYYPDVDIFTTYHAYSERPPSNLSFSVDGVERAINKSEWIIYFLWIPPLRPITSEPSWSAAAVEEASSLCSMMMLLAHVAKEWKCPSISTHVLVCLLQQQRTQIGSSSLSADDIIIIDCAAVGLLLRMMTTTKFRPHTEKRIKTFLFCPWPRSRVKKV